MPADVVAERRIREIALIGRQPARLIAGVFALATVVALSGKLLAQDATRDSLPARQISAVELDEVLEQLQANLSEYRHTVPDLFCNEHVVSSLDERRSRTATVTDSTFRLRKTEKEDGLVEFEESRAVKAVDGKVPLSDAEGLSGPALLYGVFSDGLQVVSKELRACYEYKMHPGRPGHPRDKLLVEFKDGMREDRPVACPPFEGTSGLATIDPVSMNVLRLEKTTPDRTRFLGKIAIWKWTVDYRPVPLAGKMFWMPQTIRSTSRTTDGQYVWEFDGTYRGYHLFKAESRIVPVVP